MLLHYIPTEWKIFQNQLEQGPIALLPNDLGKCNQFVQSHSLQGKYNTSYNELGLLLHPNPIHFRPYFTSKDIYEGANRPCPNSNDKLHSFQVCFYITIKGAITKQITVSLQCCYISIY